MIGIYKITSPSGRVYIGQSINIKKRFREYKSLSCKAQTKLFNSFNKYGVENHKFEIITECDLSQLNDLERYYQEVYNAIHYKYGLNCMLTKSSDKSGYMSQESRDRNSKSKKGIKLTFEQRQARIGVMAGEKHWGYGKERTAETKEKLRIANLGKKQSEETKLKRSLSTRRGKNQCAKKVIDVLSGEVFLCAKDAAEKANINYYTFSQYLRGARTNKTTFKYL